ncbi:MAG: hypothetical protein ACR2H5_17000 [Ktedonobacteraceae bacterium]
MLELSLKVRENLTKWATIKEGSAQLRVARDMKNFAERILSVLNALPDEVTSDSISFPPFLLQFETAIELKVQEPAEE